MSSSWITLKRSNIWSNPTSLTFTIDGAFNYSFTGDISDRISVISNGDWGKWNEAVWAWEAVANIDLTSTTVPGGADKCEDAS